MVWDEKKKWYALQWSSSLQTLSYHGRGKEEMHGKRFQRIWWPVKLQFYKVDARTVSERLLSVVITRHKVKTKEQLAASGISPENNLLDDAVEL